METFYVAKVSAGFLLPLADLFFNYLYYSNTENEHHGIAKTKEIF